MTARVVDIFMVYQFLRRLVTPFDQWEAYKLGVIDANGKVIKSRSSLTPQQSEAFGLFDVLVANLKKLLAKVPAGQTAVASYAAALLLLKEHREPRKELVENHDLLVRELSNQVRKVREEGVPATVTKFIAEECPANNVGAGHIAGTDEHPPMTTRRKKRILRRPKPQTFKEWSSAVDVPERLRAGRHDDIEWPRGWKTEVGFKLVKRVGNFLKKRREKG